MGGIVAIVLGGFALWTGVAPGEFAFDVGVSPWVIAFIAMAGVAYAWLLVRALMQMRKESTANPPVTALVGGSALAQTLIAPTGIAYAGGESWSARSDTEIRPGTPLRVIGVDGLELIVEPAPAGGGGTTEG